MLQKKLVLSIIAFISIIIFILWLLKPISIDVVHPTSGPAIQAIYATGTVESIVMLPIAARASARISELHVDEGDSIQKGQLLGKLEDEDLQKILEELQAKEIYAKVALDRNSALIKKNSIPINDFDRTIAEWKAAKAAVDRAKSQANFMKLISPTDGMIIKRDGEIGQLIAANQPVFWITDNSGLRISAEVDEEDIAEVKPNQSVLINADAFPGKTFHGRVKNITPKGDPISRSYRVRIEFNETTPLQIGMTSEVNIIIKEKKEALLVPASAIKDNKLWKIENNTLIEQALEVGIRGQDKIEILGGVTKNDLVVVLYDDSFKSGQSVHGIIRD